MKKYIFIVLMIFINPSVHAVETNGLEQLHSDIVQLESIINNAPTQLLDRQKELVELKDLSQLIKKAVTEMMEAKIICAESSFSKTIEVCKRYQKLNLNDFLFEKRQEIAAAMIKARGSVEEAEKLKKEIPKYMKILNSMKTSEEVFNRLKH